MGIRDRLAGFHQSDHNIADVFSDFNQLLHLKAAGKQLFLQFLRDNINIYIIF